MKTILPTLLVVGALIAIGGCDRDAGPHGYQGVIELDERQLGFEIGGRLRELVVMDGDRIAAGQRLAALDDTLEKSARQAREQDAAAARAQTDLVRAGTRAEELRSMAAQLDAARAVEDMIATELARERNLIAEGASTEATIDQLSARHRGAAADRRALEARYQLLKRGARPQEISGAEARAGAAAAAVDQASERVKRQELVAPAAGVVLDTPFEAGEVVGPGAAVVTMADPTRPYVDVYVPEAEIGGVDVGDRATVAVDSLPDALPARVEHIARKTEFTPRFLFSETERANLVLRVRLRIDDPTERLHAGIPAFATIERATAAKAAAR